MKRKQLAIGSPALLAALMCAGCGQAQVGADISARSVSRARPPDQKP